MSRLYWAFVVPLAALFDWGRRMFETRKQIRKAAIKKGIERGVRKGLRQAVRDAVDEERKRILASWEELQGLSRKEAEKRIRQVKRP